MAVVQPNLLFEILTNEELGQVPSQILEKLLTWSGQYEERIVDKQVLIDYWEFIAHTHEKTNVVLIAQLKECSEKISALERDKNLAFEERDSLLKCIDHRQKIENQKNARIDALKTQNEALHVKENCMEKELTDCLNQTITEETVQNSDLEDIIVENDEKCRNHKTKMLSLIKYVQDVSHKITGMTKTIIQIKDSYIEEFIEIQKGAKLYANSYEDTRNERNELVNAVDVLTRIIAQANQELVNLETIFEAAECKEPINNQKSELIRQLELLRTAEPSKSSVGGTFGSHKRPPEQDDESVPHLKRVCAEASTSKTAAALAKHYEEMQHDFPINVPKEHDASDNQSN